MTRHELAQQLPTHALNHGHGPVAKEHGRRISEVRAGALGGSPAIVCTHERQMVAAAAGALRQLLLCQGGCPPGIGLYRQYPWVPAAEDAFIAMHSYTHARAPGGRCGQFLLSSMAARLAPACIGKTHGSLQQKMASQDFHKVLVHQRQTVTAAASALRQVLLCQRDRPPVTSLYGQHPMDPSREDPSHKVIIRMHEGSVIAGAPVALCQPL